MTPDATATRSGPSLRGVGSSSDGRSQSIYSPRPEGQAEAIRAAHLAAGVTPADIELVEAHGTGTPVGDAMEFQGLGMAFGQERGNRPEGEPWCAVGSVKAQIGHAKAAAGAASLVKTVLSLHHKVFPATMKVGKPNPKVVAAADSPFYLSTETRPWFAAAGKPRLAGVSSFGFGGSNFHIVLEEAEASKPEPAWDGTAQIVALSAKSVDELQTAVKSWLQELAESDIVNSLDYKCSQSRKRFDSSASHRAVVVGGDMEELRSLLEHLSGHLSEKPLEALYHKSLFYNVGKPNGKVAVLFPGQGSQYVGMGRDLACHFPEAFAAIDAARDLGEGNPPLDRLLYPIPSFDAKEKKAREALLSRTDLTQPALAAVETAAWDVLELVGLAPDSAAGHSFGELVALGASGRLSWAEVQRLSALRGRLMAQVSGSGGAMAAVQAPLAELDAFLQEGDLGVVLANRNSPMQGVLSGPAEAVTKAEKACDAKGWRTRRLPVSGAFHSPAMEGARATYRAALDEVAFGSGRFPVFANVTGETYPDDAGAARDLLAGQLANPVRWVETVEALYAEGVRIFLETGPKSVLCGLVSATLGERPHTVVSVDASAGRQSGVGDLARALAQLAALGVAVDLTRWESPVSVPRKPRMNIPISGANYRDPSRTQRPPAEKKEPAAVAASVAAAPTPAMSLVNAAGAAQMLQGVQAGLKAVQEIQQQTADLHRRFLENQEAAQRSLQMVIQGQQTLLGQSGGVSAQPYVSQPQGFAAPPTATPVATPMAAASSAAAETASSPAKTVPTGGILGRLKDSLLGVVSDLTGYPHEMLDLDMDMEADLGIDSIKRVEILAALQKRVPKMPTLNAALLGTLRTLREVADYAAKTIGEAEHAVAPKLSTAPSAPAPSPKSVGAPPKPAPLAPTPPPSAGPDASAQPQVEGELMSVVSDLTGYPPDMLQPDMDMEADLGIDSIKRVEILAALQKRVPKLPTINSVYLGSLRTLRQVMDHVIGTIEESEPGKRKAAKAAGGPSAKQASAPPASPAPPRPAVGNETVQAAVIATIAQLTGYPPEMLTAEMDLEADLGIDSIKRVEILAELQKVIPNISQISSAHVSTLRTLGQVSETVAAAMGGDSKAAAKTEQLGSKTEVKAPSDPARRQILTAFELGKATAPGALRLAREGSVLVAGEPGTLSDALVSALREAGHDAVASSLSEAASVAGRLKAKGLIVLGFGRSTSTAILRREVSGDVKAAFSALRAALPGLREAAACGGSLLASVTQLGGDFGLSGVIGTDPVEAALAGMVKTAGQECPEITCRALDLAPLADGAAKEIAASIIRELAVEGPTEIGLKGTRRFGLRLVESPIEANGPLPVGSGDTIVVTGGGRGVTAACALELARASGARMLLLGRSPQPVEEPAWLAGAATPAEIKKALLGNRFTGNGKPKPSEVEAECRRVVGAREITTNLSLFHEAGLKAVYRSIDTRDAAQLSALLAEERNTGQKIAGIIHGAGVIEDRLIEAKTDDQFARVFDTKVDGLRALLDVTASETLKFIALFSSVSARFGNRGQADYAAANEVLNKAAWRLAGMLTGCRVVAFNWGPWDGGMVTPQLKREFERRGVGVLPVDSGTSALVNELRQPTGPCEVVIDWPGAATFGEGGAPASPTAASKRQSALASAPESDLVVAFRMVLDPAGHPWLKSHVLAGRPVLPVAMMFEFFAHAALHEHPGLLFQGIDRFQVFRPITVQDPDAPCLEVSLSRPRRKNGAFEIDAELRIDGDSIPRTRGCVILSSRLADAPAVSALGGYAPYPLSAEACYRDVLFHGPQFQVVRRIDGVSPSGLIASVGAAGSPAEWMTAPHRPKWATEPALLDGCLQLPILWCHSQRGMVCLPSHGASYRQFAPLNDIREATAVFSVSEATELEVTGDVSLIGTDGRLLARFEGFEWLMDPALAAAFHRSESAVTGR